MIKPILLCAVFMSAHSFAQSSFSIQHFEELNDANQELGDDNVISYSYKKDEKKRKKWSSKLEAQVQFHTASNKAAFAAPEFYIRYKKRGTKVYLGRKILGWNPSEKFWSLGHLDGNRNFSLLENNQEGHFGLHLERSIGRTTFSVFGSGIHIPEINPGLTEEDGRLVGTNRWAQPVPTQTRIAFDNPTLIPMRYSLDLPEVRDLLVQESLGARVKHDWRSGSISTYGIYKGENQLRVSAVGRLNEEQTQADVSVRPFTNQTFIYGANLSQKVTNNIVLETGAMSVNPRTGRDTSLEFVGFRVRPQYLKEHYFHSSATYTGRNLTTSLNFIELINKPEPITDNFSKRPRWQRAIGFNTRYHFTDRFHLLLDAKHDILLKDTVVQAQTGYQFTENLVVALGLEMIDSPSEESFWTFYRTNDSVYTNLQYQF